MGLLNKLFGKKSNLKSEGTDNTYTSNSEIYRLYVDEIFTIKNLGCIVVGIVKGADIRINDEVDIIDANGNRLASKIMGIENPRVGKMNIAPVGSQVGILLTNIEAKQLHRGDILTNEKIN